MEIFQSIGRAKLVSRMDSVRQECSAWTICDPFGVLDA